MEVEVVVDLDMIILDLMVAQLLMEVCPNHCSICDDAIFVLHNCSPIGGGSAVGSGGGGIGGYGGDRGDRSGGGGFR